MKGSVGTTAFLLAAGAALVAGLFAWRLTLPAQVHADELEQLGLYVFPAARTLPPFSLTGTDRSPVVNADLQGRWTVVFFGFTHCPDVCPTTLAEIAASWRALPEPEQQRLQVWMASVDPARDLPEHLRNYLDYFDPRVRGLTGTVPEMAAFARLFNAIFARVPGDGENYQVDHSAHLALVNPAGDFAAILRPPVGRENLQRALKLLLHHYPFKVIGTR